MKAFCDKFIQLPNGDTLRADTITAIRLGDADEGAGSSKSAMRWRVVVDYNYNSVALYANSKEERDHLAAKLRAELLPAVVKVR